VIDPFRAALLDKQLADICQLVLFFCFFCWPFLSALEDFLGGGAP
jgi:hypothetical protein